jgi:small-conductance mechanosensitive channel
LNKKLVVAETANDEQLLDQLVQELFLEHLRRELVGQKKSIDENNDKLFNLERKFVAEFKKLTVPLETMSDTLGEQTRELNDAKDDAQRHYLTLLNSLAQNRADTTALHDIFQQQNRKHHQEQIEQLQCIHEHLPQQSARLQEQNAALTALTEQQVSLSHQQVALQEQLFSATLAEMKAQNVMLESLTEQNKSLHQQMLTLEDKQRAELQSNRLWGKLVTGFTLVNTLILVSMTTLFFIQHGT